MEKKMEILYKVHNNLYINLTNRCPYSCTFCLRQKMDKVGESDTLWLLREPTAEEVIEELKNGMLTASMRLYSVDLESLRRLSMY